MKAQAQAVVVALALVALAACGEKKPAAPAAGGGTGGEAPAAAAANPGGGGGGDTKPYVAAEHTGSISGTVKFGGTAETANPINVASDTFCNGAWPDGGPTDPKFTVNADTTLPNVFVYAKDGPQKGFSGYGVPSGFHVDQKNCMYVPHVFGVMEGQSFLVKNSDQTTHNVNVKPKRNAPINKGQGAGAEDTLVFAKRDKAIPFTCDVHSWMSAYCWVLEHPFFATTDASGKFEIKGLPAGKYKFAIWHEKYGEAEFDVEVGADANAVDWTLSGK